MRRQNRMKAAALFMVCLLFLSGAAWAQPVEVSEKSDLWLKFGRGFSNTFLGYMEIVDETLEYFRTENYVAAFPAGVLKGLYYGTLRTVAGVYELVTFPIPIPADYMPVIAPLGD